MRIAGAAEKGPEEQPDQPVRRPVPTPVPPTTVQQVIALQSAVGNRAVAALLRQPAPAFSPAPAPGVFPNVPPAPVPPLTPGPAALSPGQEEAAIARASAEEAARIHRQLNAKAGPDGKVPVDFPQWSTGLEPARVEQLKAPAKAAKEKPFKAFAAARQPLYDGMHAAKDDDARRVARAALRAFDAPRLPMLRQLQAELGGVWDVEDEGARDAVLAAIGLEAISNAEGDLLNKPDDVKKRVASPDKEGNFPEWCGFFTLDQYKSSRLDSDLRAGFPSVERAEAFFTYAYKNFPAGYIKKWIWAEGEWQLLNAYHAKHGGKHGGLRRWLPYTKLSGGGDLELDPGDVVIVDVGLDGTPNHIAMVHTYDPLTSTLVTVGGNDGGKVIDTKAAKDAPLSSKREKAVGQKLTDAAPGTGGHVGVSEHAVKAVGKQRGSVYAIGRASLVDFEDHVYSNSLEDKPPAPLKQ